MRSELEPLLLLLWGGESTAHVWSEILCSYVSARPPAVLEARVSHPLSDEVEVVEMRPKTCHSKVLDQVNTGCGHLRHAQRLCVPGKSAHCSAGAGCCSQRPRLAFTWEMFPCEKSTCRSCACNCSPVWGTGMHRASRASGTPVQFLWRCPLCAFTSWSLKS